MSEPRINVYVCQKCGGYTVTVDVDEGTTPFMIGCRAGAIEDFGEGVAVVNNKCKGFAYSSFYPRGPKPPHIGDPKWEWYKPTMTDLASRYTGQTLRNMAEHVDKGGLDIRRRTNRPALMHAEVPA